MYFDAVYYLVVITFLCLVRWSAATVSSESGNPDAADAALDKFASLRTEIQELTASSNIASISVAVSRSEQIIWEEAFGWANREKKIKAVPQTIYSLASLTKPPKAAAIMILAERPA